MRCIRRREGTFCQAVAVNQHGNGEAPDGTGIMGFAADLPTDLIVANHFLLTHLFRAFFRYLGTNRGNRRFLGNGCRLVHQVGHTVLNRFAAQHDIGIKLFRTLLQLVTGQIDGHIDPVVTRPNGGIKNFSQLLLQVTLHANPVGQ